MGCTPAGVSGLRCTDTFRQLVESQGATYRIQLRNEVSAQVRAEYRILGEVAQRLGLCRSAVGHARSRKRGLGLDNAGRVDDATIGLSFVRHPCRHVRRAAAPGHDSEPCE